MASPCEFGEGDAIQSIQRVPIDVRSWSHLPFGIPAARGRGQKEQRNGELGTECKRHQATGTRGTDWARAARGSPRRRACDDPGFGARGGMSGC